MFTFNPDLVVGDDEGAEDIVYENDEVCYSSLYNI